MKHLRFILVGLCLATAALSFMPSHADGDRKHRYGRHKSEHKHEHEHDHDQALKAVRNGEVMPLEQLLALVRTRFDGVVVHTRLEREDDGWVYELKIVDLNGRMREIYVNAKTGKPINIEDD